MESAMVLNATLEIALQNATVSPATAANFQLREVVISIVYFMGVIGNLSALSFLYLSSTAPRNQNHSLVLKCLALNDLLAVLGMWVQMNLKWHMPSVVPERWFCAFRVIWRSFGIGSGCIVCVMAIERWTALTRPFFYYKNVNVAVIKKAISILWAINLAIVCAPFLGFGLYYRDGKCVRYKEGVKPLERLYAFVYFTYGFLCCCTLILCNLAVVKKLVGAKQKKKVLVRRISRNRDLCYSSSSEELAFARLMGLLCIVIIICWLPQLITIPMAQLFPKSKICKHFINVGDLIYALHFTIDPYFYILLRWSWFKSLCRKKVNSRGNSTKTTQDLCTL